LKTVEENVSKNGNFSLKKKHANFSKNAKFKKLHKKFSKKRKISKNVQESF